MQAAQFAAQAIEFGRAFVLQKAVIGNTAQKGGRKLHRQGSAVGHGQKVRPLLWRIGHSDGGMGFTRQAQHFPQRPEGVHVGLKGVGARGLRRMQKSRYVGKGVKRKDRAARSRARGPVRGFLINARGKVHVLRRVQRGQVQGTFTSDA